MMFSFSLGRIDSTINLDCTLRCISDHGNKRCVNFIMLLSGGNKCTLIKNPRY